MLRTLIRDMFLFKKKRFAILIIITTWIIYILTMLMHYNPISYGQSANKEHTVSIQVRDDEDIIKTIDRLEMSMDVLRKHFNLKKVSKRKKKRSALYSFYIMRDMFAQLQLCNKWIRQEIDENNDIEAFFSGGNYILYTYLDYCGEAAESPFVTHKEALYYYDKMLLGNADAKDIIKIFLRRENTYDAIEVDTTCESCNPIGLILIGILELREGRPSRSWHNFIAAIDLLYSRRLYVYGNKFRWDVSQDANGAPIRFSYELYRALYYSDLDLSKKIAEYLSVMSDIKKKRIKEYFEILEKQRENSEKNIEERKRPSFIKLSYGDGSDLIDEIRMSEYKQ